MKKKNYIFLIFSFLLITYLFADAVIMEFSGEPAQDKIVLKWKTGVETNVQKFVVERSLNNKSFTSIGEVAAKGSNSQYEYIDQTIADSKAIFYYRLKVVNNDGSFQFTESIAVIPKISSLARTWGSIKALFQ
ncbi:MAG: hypothetical protein D6748_04695 [Calditrichaeota bacterium]|nr:MAG: hypothetical protein D6748_04695 [Calditrichota bacterium]